MESYGGLIILIIGVAIIILWSNGLFSSKSPDSTTNDLKMKLDRAILEKKQAEVGAEQLAIRLFNGYKEKEIENIKAHITELAKKEASNQLETWKQEYTIKIRSEAIKNSSSVISGKVSEHFVPFSSEDFTFNPKEARFIGDPIDMIVFSGIDEGYATIYILEIKTGKSFLTKRQKVIKDAVINGRMYWKEIKVDAMKTAPSNE